MNDLQYIRQIRALDGWIGGGKMWVMYCREFGCDYPIGRDRFCRIYNENGFKMRLRIAKPHTTDSTHGLPTYPDLTKDFIPAGPNQLWVSDITYIFIMDDDCHYHFCYLSMILDAYTEEIVGWSVGPTLDTTYPMEALRMALRRIEGKAVNLMHHSDRGCQYASREYVKTLRDNGIQISMTESGDPKDNTRRPHMSVGMMTPAQAAGTAGDRDMRWTSYLLMAIKSRDREDVPEKCLPLSSCQGPPSGLRPPVNP